MSDLNSLESLQALHADLLALSASRLRDLERLGAQIDAHIGDFKDLLDKKVRNDQSRQTLASGNIEVQGDQYTVNEEFQQGALQVADELNLDELDAAQLFLEAQREAEESGRPVITCALIRFHQRRKYLLDCLGLILQLSADVNLEETIRADLQQVVSNLVQPQESLKGSTTYVQKCLSSMENIKSWLQNLADKSSSASVLGQGQQPLLLETIEYQRVSLVKQHESLGIIVLYLVKENHSVMADFELVLATLKRLDKYDNLLLHHFPALAAYISRFGSPEGGGTLAEARTLNERFLSQTEHDSWALSYVYAAFRAWWLAEYGGWYGENYDGSIPENQLEEENKQRSRQFTEALKDGAFDFILSFSADVKSVDWHDPARHSLRQWLQRKAPALMSDSVSFSDFFQEALMEQLETFIESFITNLPDVLRKLRVEEDEQRQLSKEHEHDLDLERFIVIISYAFETRPKAALEAFWDVPDGALMGFMHWASRRASTPLVSAFCEMLQAISEDEECATAAHEFLLDEGPQSSGKMRRTHSLTWNQIIKELTFFSNKIRDRPALPQTQTYRPGKPNSDHAETEPESSWMLESYLRLITRLCSQSGAARQFLGQHPTFHLTELLFQLASSSIQPRLRACAFTTLRSLLSQKTKEAGEYLWAALDVWTTGGYSPGSNMPRTSASASTTTSAPSISAILKAIANGFEEPNAFVQFLQALVSPYTDEAGLRDGLPFPENLGISSRMPGIDPYIDFAIGQIFGSRVSELSDIVQQRLLQLTCLSFISTCIDTFNEDLVIFANRSNVDVDAAITASNLHNYVLLHPFSRVMEWMFNDKVMNTLFATIHQNAADVGNAEPDSPLILCLMRGIHVVTAILDLQSTYLDIVRPLIKLQSTHRRVPVSNAAFASFEDGILNHLSILPDLGLYCGTGHPDLIIVSLKLLGKLSASPRLTSAPSAAFGRGADRNKTIAALEDDAEEISKCLLREMDNNIDANQGSESSAYMIKLQILDFLAVCLEASPGQPTIAHLLLGFQCTNNVINIDANGSFGNGISLFHTILGLVLDTPVGDDVSLSSWLVSLKYKGLQVLRQLWLSPLSSHLTLTEMRANDSFFIMFFKEVLIQPGILWDGVDHADPSFFLSTGAFCLSEFLYQRAAILQYASTELRQVSRNHSPSLKQRILGTLMGSTVVEDGQQVENANIFDLFDFMELEFDRSTLPPLLSWFKDIDLTACLEIHDEYLSLYDLRKVEELLALRREELVHSKKVENAQDFNIVQIQAQELVTFLARDNQTKLFWASRLNVLRAWVQLTLMIIETGDFDSASKTTFVLRTLQTILPRLESNLENIDEALELARLARALLFSLDFDSDSFKQGDMGDLVGDRLFHLFQISLRAINSLGSNAALKEIFYSISYRYLMGMSDVSGVSGVHRRHSTQTIKAAGERFIDLICDDAYASEPTCRIAALLVLGALVKMAKKENSKYIIESLGRLNFIGILVDSVQNIPTDLRETSREDIGLQVSYCHARLALLLQISQTRPGATAVINAGLFHSIKVSGLFATDPDLGVDIDDEDAITKHYELLAAVTRVICAAVLSRGPQNEQTLAQGRKFLAENRLSILAVLKKSAGLGVAEDPEQGIEELAEFFMLLISVTGFLDLEEQTDKKRGSLKAFT